MAFFEEFDRYTSGNVTLSVIGGGSSVVIDHLNYTNNPIIVGVGVEQVWGGDLVANFSSSVNADTGQTATAYNSAAISSGWLELNGSNQYLTYPDNADYTIGSSDATIEFEVQFDSTSGNQHIVNDAGPGELYAWAFIRSGSSLLVFAGSSTNRDVLNDVSFGTITTGTTYKVALVKSGNNFYGYLNGTRVFSQTSSLPLLDPSGTITFGRPASVDTEFLDGRIRRFSLNVGTAKYTGDTYTTQSGAWEASPVTKTHLALGIDFTAQTTESGTTITNISGNSLFSKFDLFFCKG